MTSLLRNKKQLNYMKQTKNRVKMTMADQTIKILGNKNEKMIKRLALLLRKNSLEVVKFWHLMVQFFLLPISRKFNGILAEALQNM